MSEVENAAVRVKKAMRALEVHPHDSAPMLEREYRRALETYFLAAEKVAGRIDEEREEAAEDADEEARAYDLRRDVESIAGHFAAAKRALRLARAYRMEPATSGRRERECIEAVQRHRDSVRALRLRMRPVAEQLALPGLAKTRPDAFVPGAVRSA